MQTVALAAEKDRRRQRPVPFRVRLAGFTRSTYDRALESLDAVNHEIEGLIQAAWGR